VSGNLEQKVAYVDELERLLRTVSSIIKRRGRDILSNFDITPPQFNALLILRNHGNLTIGELGEKMYLACSTATDLIDRMERNGLVERRRDQNDRRVIRLHVKEKGMEMVQAVMAARKCYLSGILDQISEEEILVMINGMRHLQELMTGAHPDK
jgi:DNA-binding MarR family transcriptional regulator